MASSSALPTKGKGAKSPSIKSEQSGNGVCPEIKQEDLSSSVIGDIASFIDDAPSPIEPEGAFRKPKAPYPSCIAPCAKYETSETPSLTTRDGVESPDFVGSSAHAVYVTVAEASQDELPPKPEYENDWSVPISHAKGEIDHDEWDGIKRKVETNRSLNRDPEPVTDESSSEEQTYAVPLDANGNPKGLFAYRDAMKACHSDPNKRIVAPDAHSDAPPALVKTVSHPSQEIIDSTKIEIKDIQFAKTFDCTIMVPNIYSKQPGKIVKFGIKAAAVVGFLATCDELEPLFEPLLARAKDSPGVVTIEDDPCALKMILAIAHHRFDLIPHEADATVLFHLLWVLRKYDCAYITRPWNKKWCEDLLSRGFDGGVALDKGIFIAWELGHIELFRVYIREMVELSRIKDGILVSNRGRPVRPELLAEGVADIIMKKRTDVMYELLRKIRHPVQALVEGRRETKRGEPVKLCRAINNPDTDACEHMIIGTGVYQLAKNGLFPPPDERTYDGSIKILYTALREMKIHALLERGVPPHLRHHQACGLDVQSPIMDTAPVLTEGMSRHLTYNAMKSGVYSEELFMGYDPYYGKLPQPDSTFGGIIEVPEEETWDPVVLDPKKHLTPERYAELKQKYKKYNFMK